MILYYLLYLMESDLFPNLAPTIDALISKQVKKTSSNAFLY